LGYRAANVQASSGSNGVSQALLSFGEASARFYQGYDRAAEQQADARANEILTKMTPEQLRAATADGTLLYQDDQRAMRALRFKTGRNSAFEVETDIQQKVAQGAFKTQKDLVEYRNERLNNALKSYAEAYGIDAQDEDYMRGFSADIVQRSAAVFDHHARFLSQQTQAMAQMQAASDLGSLFADEGFLRSPTGPQEFANYFTASLESGSIPTDGAAVSALRDALSQNAAQPGADAFFKNLGDKEVVLYGQPRKIRDIVGPEVLESYQVKAGEAAFKRSRELSLSFHSDLQDALDNPDSHAALSQLDLLRSRLNSIQDSSMVTSQTEMLDAARGRVLGNIREANSKAAKAIEKQAKADDRMLAIVQQWQRKMKGELVSTDPALMATNEATGEYTREDEANAAHFIMNRINSGTLSDTEKTNLTLRYVAADREGGPFKKIMGEFVDQAMSEWDGLVISGETQRDYPALDRLRQLVKAEPVQMARLYKEKAELMLKLNAMDRVGIDFSVVVEAERAQTQLTREERNAQARDFTVLMRKSNSLAGAMPAEMNGMARAVYDAHVALTGSPKSAERATEDFVSRNTVTFGQGQAIGKVFKTDLMLDPADPDSWKAGQTAVDSALEEFMQAHPEYARGSVCVVSRGDHLFIQTWNGRIQPIDFDGIKAEYLGKKAEAQAKAKAAEEERRAQEIRSIKRSQEGFKGYAQP